MKKAESQEEPIVGSLAKKWAGRMPKRTPEEQAKIDQFDREIGPAMVEALNKGVRENLPTS